MREQKVFDFQRVELLEKQYIDVSISRRKIDLKEGSSRASKRC